ncbi:PAS domain-containing protein, partial [Streptomyces alkaliphilus]|uniref:PAS domain-containing protein n=1 Tax=Streptomyces alkaliphilus TaxID=1472722 RepID=UPI001196A9AE
MTDRVEPWGAGSADRGEPAELMLDAAGEILNCTRSAARLLGGGAEELRGHPVGDFFAPPSTWVWLSSDVSPLEHRSLRVVLRRLGGDTVAAEVDLSELPEGSPLRFVVRLSIVPGTSEAGPRPPERRPPR